MYYIKEYYDFILEMAGVDEDEEDSISLLYNHFLELRNSKLFNFYDNIIDLDINKKRISYNDNINKELNNDIDFFSLVNIHNETPLYNPLKKLILNNIRLEEFDDSPLNNYHVNDIERILEKYDISITNDYLVIPLIFENQKNKILYYIIKDLTMNYFIIKSIHFNDDKKLMYGIKYSNGKKHYDEIGIGNTTNLRKYLTFYNYDGKLLNNDFIKITRNTINNYNFPDFINYSVYKLTTSLIRDINDTLKFL